MCVFHYQHKGDLNLNFFFSMRISNEISTFVYYYTALQCVNIKVYLMTVTILYWGGLDKIVAVNRIL